MPEAPRVALFVTCLVDLFRPTIGFAEAALAAHAIHPLVHPGEALHFEYSTTQGVPAL